MPNFFRGRGDREPPLIIMGYSVKSCSSKSASESFCCYRLQMWSILATNPIIDLEPSNITITFSIALFVFFNITFILTSLPIILPLEQVFMDNLKSNYYFDQVFNDLCTTEYLNSNIAEIRNNIIINIGIIAISFHALLNAYCSTTYWLSLS